MGSSGAPLWPRPWHLNISRHEQAPHRQISVKTAAATTDAAATAPLSPSSTLGWIAWALGSALWRRAARRGCCCRRFEAFLAAAARAAARADARADARAATACSEDLCGGQPTNLTEAPGPVNGGHGASLRHTHVRHGATAQCGPSVLGRRPRPTQARGRPALAIAVL
jgi:hypothetical protein